MHTTFASIASLLLVFTAGGCATVKLTSRWGSAPIKVDGQLTEWTDTKEFVEAEGIRLAVRNDGAFLYVALDGRRKEGEQRRSLGGLTIWFDGEGGSTKRYGIRYPLLPVRGTGGQWREERNDPGSLMRDEAFDEMTAECEWLGPEEHDIERVPRLNRNDLVVAIHRGPDGFGYELKIPLMSGGNHLYAVDAKPGSMLGVAVEVGASSGEMRPPEGGRTRNARGPGAMAPADRPREGPPPEREGRAARPMKTETTWFKVHLAAS